MKRAAAAIFILILILIWAAYAWVTPDLALIDRRVDVASNRNYPMHLEQAVIAAEYPDLVVSRSFLRGVPLSLRLAKGQGLHALVSAFFSGLKHTQREILRSHMETVYLGQSGPRLIIGIEDGATVIARKPAEKLNLPESALLAGMIHSPEKRTLQRRNEVLSKMRELGMITRDEYEKAIRAPLP